MEFAGAAKRPTTESWTAPGPSLQRARMFALLISLLATLLGTPAHGTAVQTIDAGPSTITLRFDGPVNAVSAFVVDGPRRIAVDVSGAAPGAITTPGGPVANIRQGRFDKATTRLVFDLSDPAVVTGGTFSADGRTLTLSLRSVDATSFVTGVRRGRISFTPPAGTGVGMRSARYNVTVPLDPPEGAPRLPPVQGTQDRSRPLVVIDAGHGGHDPGALSTDKHAREKDVTLAVAKAIRDELVKGGRVRVALTRSDDRFIVLRDRFEIARRMGADMFISIHADSAPSPDAHGATIYTLSEVASDREAALLAQRENKVDIVHGVNLSGENADVTSILIDLAQRETMNTAAGFARLLQREAAPDVPFRPTPHRMASLMVLKAPDVPSLLFECGYITNEGDLDFIASKKGQESIAKGFRQALEIHFARKMASR
jgi:N-acetylmuramoyl-L-alanine amidase